MAIWVASLLDAETKDLIDAIWVNAELRREAESIARIEFADRYPHLDGERMDLRVTEASRVTFIQLEED